MENVFTVTLLNKYIKNLLDEDQILSDVVVKGEISNYKLHYSGHMYFTLKDEGSLVRCVMFKMQGMRIKFEPADGMKVIARGSISVFERDGQYQLYVRDMQPDGIGSLYLAFMQLKGKLEKEGLFDRSHKRQVPFLPRSIGVVTSSTGAVIRDIINITGRRAPGVNIRLFPVAVQGEGAAGQIAHAIDRINELGCADVIIVARGGGSLEELWAFNEEIVARSIYRSKIPVISAVGHETDYTISDFTADLRAPTPSAAAEMAVPEREILLQDIAVKKGRLISALSGIVALKNAAHDKIMSRVVFRKPFDRINQIRQAVDNQTRYLHLAASNAAAIKKAGFAGTTAKLEALSPLSILSRGYCVVSDKLTGKLIKSVKALKMDDRLLVRVTDGLTGCKVTDVVEGDLENL